MKSAPDAAWEAHTPGRVRRYVCTLLHGRARVVSHVTRAPARALDAALPYRAIETLSSLQRSLPEAVKLMLLNGVSDTMPKKLL